MDNIVVKGKGSDNKKGLIIKKWERCKSFGGRARPPTTGGSGSNSPSTGPRRRIPKKSKSWNGSSNLNHAKANPRKDRGNKSRVAPDGCFAVYVGPHKQRVVVKTKHVNHPIFRALLEEAESEFGYSCTGPIELPCDVNLFFRVLMEMDSDNGIGGPRRGCGFPTPGGAYRLLSPSRMVAINQI